MNQAEVDISGTVFDRFRKEEDSCFLCGIQLTADNRTVEHVFPRWLLRLHNLWDKQLTLVNGTSIPYRQLTIPCCNVCNSTFLSELEDRVRVAFESGYTHVASLSPLTLFQWTGKIFFGILRKELTLLRRRECTDCGPIITGKRLREYENLHLLLQSIREPFSFSGIKPFTAL